MYCSGCGQALAAGQGFCPQCGRPVAPPAPPIPGMNFLVDAYGGKIKTLAIFWFIYAGLSFLVCIMGMAFVRAWTSHFGWGHGPWNSDFPFGSWFGPTLVHLAFVFVFLRSALALAAGWGLMERAPWGRFVALVAAFLNLLKFPFGTALGIFTLVLLLGYRNNTLYHELQRTPMAY
jgi:hypothetical protein